MEPFMNEDILIEIAKIAATLVTATPHTSIDSVLVSYAKAHHVVEQNLKTLIEEHGQSYVKAQSGRDIRIVRSQDEIHQELVSARNMSTGDKSIANKTEVGTVTISGALYGPIPSWLEGLAKKAGVSEVFDNRGSLEENPKRPHFVSTDGSKTPFWPPKEYNQSKLTNKSIGMHNNSWGVKK
jgi:hypothetical protein